MDPGPLPHRPFPKIPTTLAETPGAGSSWVATEKIHGAQLVLGCDGERVAFGKRKAWLAEDEAFFGWQLLRAELSLAALACARLLGRGGLLYIYGELFGGAYPHESVDGLPGICAVQTGIWYAPGLHFAAFDMLVGEGEGEGEGETARFLARSELERVAGEAGLSTVPILGRGTRRELERLPVRYPSTLPGHLGLPPLVDNIAEGYVLVPDRELPAARRPVVKHKIPEFDENRFDASVPFDAHAHLSISQLLRWAQTMVNPVRLASARSKVGEDPEAIADEALLDVCIDLEAVFPRRLGALTPEEDERLRTAIEALIRDALP